MIKVILILLLATILNADCLILESEGFIRKIEVLGCGLIRFRFADSIGTRYDLYATKDTVCLDETAQQIECASLAKRDFIFTVQESENYPPEAGVAIQIMKSGTP